MISRSSVPEAVRVALPLDVLRAVLVGVPQPVEQRAVARPHRVELIDPARGGVDELLARVGLLLAQLRIGAEAEPPDEPRQGQPLAQQREHDDGQRHDEERLARGERPAAGQGQRKGERDRERDDARACRPTRAPATARGAGAGAARRRTSARQELAREDPERADHDQDQAHDEADADEPDARWRASSERRSNGTSRPVMMKTHPVQQEG